MRFGLPDLRRFFPTAVYQRGERYFEEERVELIGIDPEGHRITAYVQGHRRKPYEVEVDVIEGPRGPAFDGGCTCPIGENCKHVVATLLTALRLADPAESPAPGLDRQTRAARSVADVRDADPEAVAIPRLQLDPELASWLREIHGAADEERRAAEERERWYLAFSLILESPWEPEVPSIEAQLVYIRKDGSFGRALTLNGATLGDPMLRARLSVDDIALVAYCDSALRPSVFERNIWPLNGSLSARVLERLLPTGRLHLGDHRGPLLRKGEPRAGRPEWQIDDVGAARLTIACEPEAHWTLPTEPPYYVDLERFTLGSIETGLAPADAARLVDAPPVPRALLDRPEARRQLGEALVKIGAPEPPEVEVVDEPRTPPVPCLEVHTVLLGAETEEDDDVADELELQALARAQQRGAGMPEALREMLLASEAEADAEAVLGPWRDEHEGPLVRVRRRQYEREAPEVLDLATLRFDYGGAVAVLEADPEPFVGRSEGARVRRRPRDREFEARARRRLEELGFRPTVNYAARAGWESLEWSEQTRGGLTLPDPDAWSSFLMDEAPRLVAEGWRIDVEHGFRHNIVDAGPLLARLSPRDEDGLREDTTIGGWLTLELGVEVEGDLVSLFPLARRAAHEARWEAPDDDPEGTPRPRLPKKRYTMTLDDGRVLAVPAERLEPVLESLSELLDTERVDKKGRLEVSQSAALPLVELSERLRVDWTRGEELLRRGEKLRALAKPGALPAIEPPAGLEATLRAYQREGLSWLCFLREAGLGGILADDMGLGKTVQALAFLLREKEEGRLTKPALVVAPTSVLGNWRREAARFAPSLRVLVLSGADRHERWEELDEAELVLTSYALLPRDRKRLTSAAFSVVILDEAQRIKNPRAKTGRIARAIPSEARYCLTGTPLENHMLELWSLFDFLEPGFLGSSQRFTRVFKNPIERRGDERRFEQLRGRVGPLMLRRTKQEVARELPPKTEDVRVAELHGAQRDLYETIRIAAQEKIAKVIEEKGIRAAQIHVLESLTRLRQVCCDPRLVKLKVARGIEESAKLDVLRDMLPTLVEEGRRILLFSQFVTMLGLIERELDELGIDYVKLTGRTKERDAPIERFQTGGVPVFLISLKAGGVGLNLTAADTVIHYDPWWNPAVEDQATDRAHRIGQDKPVFVYRLLTEGTVEERMLELQARKRALVDEVVEQGARRSAALSEEDVEALLAPVK